MSSYHQSAFQLLAQGDAVSALSIRRLTDGEQGQLEARGCLFEPGCEVWVTEDFSPQDAGLTVFRGRVVLACGPQGGVRSSVLEDATVLPGGRIEACPLVRRTILGKRAQLRGLQIDCRRPSSYGMEGCFKAGLETPGREVPFLPDGGLKDFTSLASGTGPELDIRALLPSLTRPWSFVGAGCTLNGGMWDRVILGPGVQARGVVEVSNTLGLSSPDEPLVLGAGVVVRDSVLQPGVHVDSGAQVFSSQIRDHGGAERQGLVTHSLIGSNTHVGEGEVTASLVGSFVGIHHHSLLIAAYWPQGGGNLGYGANVGSNHTGRRPDQEIRVGEGVFFGLGVNVKFPCNFLEAPYTLFATGVVVPPQKLETPFSLVVPGEGAGLRLLPGWALQENLYSLYRSHTKFRDRNKSRRGSPVPDPFSPENVDKVWKTWENLKNLSSQDVYTPVDWRGFGSCRVEKSDLDRGLKAYEDFLKFRGLQGVLNQDFQLKTLTKWETDLFFLFFTEKMEKKSLIILYIELLSSQINGVLRSLEKDFLRGEGIIEDYKTVHPDSRQDPVVLSLVEEKDRWTRVLQGLTKGS